MSVEGGEGEEEEEEAVIPTHPFVTAMPVNE